MSNLLPKDARERLWSGYRARLLIAASLVALLAAALAMAALAPSYVVLVFGASRVGGTQSSAAASQSDIQAVAHTEAVLAVLAPLVSATSSPSQAVERALADRPAGITIDHVTYAAGSPSTIVLQGASVSPEAVGAYQKALQADPFFASVSVPLSDLAGTAGGDFTVTLSGAF